MSILTRLHKGKNAEERACTYLQKQGMAFVARNYRSRYGEIDLIMKEGETLIFVEVRARSSMAFGGAVASITHRKQQKIVKTAQYYLLENRLQNKIPVRFDVVAFEEKDQIHWLKQAFGIHVQQF